MALTALLILLAISSSSWSNFQELGKQAYSRGNYSEAEKQFTQSLREAEQFEPGDWRLLASLTNLAAARTQLAKFHEAEEAFERAKPLLALPTLQRSFPEGVIENGINHAALLYRKGDPGHARKEFETVLQDAESTLGSDDQMVAQACNHLALLERDAGRLERAQLFAERALAIRQRVFGPESPEAAVTLTMLGQIAQDRHHLPEAADLFRHALTIRQTAKSNPIGVAESLSNLGLVLKTQGDYAEAERLYLQAQAIWVQTAGPDSYLTALAINNMAALRQTQGKFRAAEQQYAEAARMMERAGGPTHPLLAQVLTNFASLYRQMHQYDKAEPLLRRSLAIDELKLGPVDPRVAVDLASLADIEGARRDYAAAEPLLLRALSIQERISGKETGATARAAFRLAMLYEFRSMPERAETYYNQALSAWQVHGVADLQAAASLETYASVLKKRQQFADAEQAITVAMGIRVQAAKNGDSNAFPGGIAPASKSTVRTRY